MNINEIQEILKDNLQGKYFFVKECKSFYGTTYMQIIIAQSNRETNGVKLQHPEVIGLCLEDGKLEFQHYAGSGGRFIYRKVDSQIEKEKYNALGHESMPAIRIKDNKRALIKVCQDYMKITRDIAARGLSQY